MRTCLQTNKRPHNSTYTHKIQYRVPHVKLKNKTKNRVPHVKLNSRVPHVKLNEIK